MTQQEARRWVHDWAAGTLRDLCAERAKQAVKGGEHYKATILLRAPHLPDGDVLVTEDEDASIIAAIQRSVKAGK